MKEYIEREAVLSAIWKTSAEHDVFFPAIILGTIKAIPAADVVPAVRCKDCKWFGLAGCAIRIVDDIDKPSEDDFCSFGERKGGDE